MGYYGYADTNTPTKYHLKLLAQRDFDFAPFFDEAVVNWLHRNASRLLQTNPHCCKHFIGDDEQKATIAKYIPIDEDEHIVEFIRSLGPEDTTVYETIALRLIKAKKPDLLTNAKLSTLAHLRYNIDTTSIFNALSQEAIINIAQDLPWTECKWSIEALATFMRRLPVNKLNLIRVELIPTEIVRMRRRDDKHINKIRNQTAVALAKTLPIEDIHNFIIRMQTVITMMDCMGCGEMRASSMPGYTLHRKVCDPENKFPNALVLAAERVV